MAWCLVKHTQTTVLYFYTEVQLTLSLVPSQ